MSANGLSPESNCAANKEVRHSSSRLRPYDHHCQCLQSQCHAPPRLLEKRYPPPPRRLQSRGPCSVPATWVRGSGGLETSVRSCPNHALARRVDPSIRRCHRLETVRPSPHASWSCLHDLASSYRTRACRRHCSAIVQTSSR